MRAVTVLALVALVAGASAVDVAVRGGVAVGDEPKLHKPVIVNPLETPAVANNLAGISKILGAEPAAAADPASEASDSDADGDVEGLDDVALMGEDDCNSPLPSEKCKAKKGEGSEASAPAAKKAEHSEESSAEASGEASKGDKTEAEIHQLEKLISSAMKISKAIPDKVKRLEQLKNKEEEMTEERARAEAERTLKEHAKLLEEMKTHIGKLERKVAELKTKRQELIESDKRLRATLSGKPAESSAKESSAEESSAEESSAEASKKE